MSLKIRVELAHKDLLCPRLFFLSEEVLASDDWLYPYMRLFLFEPFLRLDIICV